MIQEQTPAYRGMAEYQNQQLHIQYFKTKALNRSHSILGGGVLPYKHVTCRFSVYQFST